MPNSLEWSHHPELPLWDLSIIQGPSRPGHSPHCIVRNQALLSVKRGYSYRDKRRLALATFQDVTPDAKEVMRARLKQRNQGL